MPYTVFFDNAMPAIQRKISEKLHPGARGYD